MFQFEIDETSNSPDPGTIPVTEFSVGDKISCGKDIGVVCYIGEVKSYSGIWLGIEWNDPSRGKHNGTVNGITYFQCQKPNAASFIRPEKANKLKDIFTALYERYGHDENVMSKLKKLDDQLEKLQVEFRALKIMDLSGRGISELGDPIKLATMCPNIEHLDLAENILCDWVQVIEVCKLLINLKLLDLSDNPLPILRSGQLEEYKNALPNLDQAVLGKLKYDWQSVLEVSKVWQKLTILHVPFNSISTLQPPQFSLLHLVSLDLDGNQITSWDEVLKLDICKSLCYLNLCGNKIASIRFPYPRTEDGKTSIFSNLKQLNLSTNLIEDWISISELNKLKSLSELRIDLNPFLEKDIRETNRQMIVARIGNLKKLEGIEISRQERRDAELDYIKKFTSAWIKEGTELKFSSEHPRYAELTIKWGESELGESFQKFKTMESDLLTLQIISETKPSKPILKQFVPTMTVAKLKMMVQRLLKIPSRVTSMTIISIRNPDLKFPLDKDFYDLSQYSIENGDKLVITW